MGAQTDTTGQPVIQEIQIVAVGLMPGGTVREMPGTAALLVAVFAACVPVSGGDIQ